MAREISRLLRWLHMDFESGNAGLVGTRCGLSRPTLRSGLCRYPEAAEDARRAESRRPLTRPNRKVSDADRATMLRLQAARRGAQRIRREWRRHEQSGRSLATRHKVLCEALVKPLGRPRAAAATEALPSCGARRARADGHDEDGAGRLTVSARASGNGGIFPPACRTRTGSGIEQGADPLKLASLNVQRTVSGTVVAHAAILLPALPRVRARY